MILITGGGTGGHLRIAKSLKKAFLELKEPVIYVGSTKGQDRQWFANDEEWEERYFLPAEGVVDKRGMQRVRSLLHILKLSREAKKIIQRHRIKAVVSVGGYSAAPASFAALQSAIPLFIHEQNATIGTLNRVLKPFCKRLFTSFAPPYDPYPVEEIFYRTRRIRRHLKTLIFLGGSQGARQINDLALSLAPTLHQKGIAIIHQCGEQDYERVARAYKELGIEVDLFPFDPQLIHKIAQADLAVARAGASTVWELAANALPAIFLPYPYAANDHQKKNAQFIAQRGGALLWEDGLDLFSLELQSMSEALERLFKPEGAKKIAQEILATL